MVRIRELKPKLKIGRVHEQERTRVCAAAREAAQQEIRDYARAMFDLIRPIVPLVAEAFLDYDLGAVHLTRLEVEAIRNGEPLKSENKREKAEWDAKRARLGLK